MYSNNRQSKQMRDSGLAAPFDDEDFGMPSRRRGSHTSSRNILSRIRGKSSNSGYAGGGDSDDDDGPSNVDFGGPDLSFQDLSGLRDRARYPMPAHGSRPVSLSSAMINQDTTPIIPTMTPGAGPSRGPMKPQDKYRHKMVESRRLLLSSESGVVPPSQPMGASTGPYSAPPRAMSLTSGPPRTMSMHSMQSMPPASGYALPPNGPMNLQGTDGRPYPMAAGASPRPLSVRPPPVVTPQATNMPYPRHSATPPVHPIQQGYYPPSPQQRAQRASMQPNTFVPQQWGPPSPWSGMRPGSRPQSPASAAPLPMSPQPKNVRGHMDSFDFDMPLGQNTNMAQRPGSAEITDLHNEIRILSIELAESTRRELGLNQRNDLAQHASALAEAERKLGLERSKRIAVESHSPIAYDIGRFADLEYRYSETTQLLDLRNQQYDSLRHRYDLEKSELAEAQNENRELKDRLREYQVTTQMSSINRGTSEHIKIVENENSQLRRQLDELSDRGPQGERVRTLEEQRSVLQEALRTMHERKDHEIWALQRRISHLESIKGRSVSKPVANGTPDFSKTSESPQEQIPLSLPRLRPQSRPTSPLHLNFDIGKDTTSQAESPRSSLALG